MSLFRVTMTPLFDPMSIRFDPSRLTVFVEERMPLTVYPCVLFAPPPKLTDSMLMGSGATTPGMMRSSSRALLPMTDRLSICFALRTPSRAPVSV